MEFNRLLSSVISAYGEIDFSSEPKVFDQKHFVQKSFETLKKIVADRAEPRGVESGKHR